MMLWRAGILVLAAAAFCGTAQASGPLLPNDPYAPWYLQTLGLPEAWSYSTGSSAVKIAILDTGVIASTPDLGGRVLPALSSTGSSPNDGTYHHHGTWVSSSVAMQINNGIGGAGVGNFSILPISVTTMDGISTPDWLSAGIRLAADQGAKAINVSIASPLGYGSLDLAAGYARSKGALTFVAAGNDNKQTFQPDFQNLIFVSGTDENDERWDSGTLGSSYGAHIDLSAPAHNILVADPLDPDLPGYGYIDGTSFAAPLAAGAAALAWSINPNLTPDQVQQILFDTAIDLGDPGRDMIYGWGRIDIGAVAAAAAATVPEPGAVLVLPLGMMLLRRRISR